jgi:Bacterial regulatory protein, arsR family
LSTRSCQNGTTDGLAAARARGRSGDQKPKLGRRQAKIARDMYDETGEDGKRKYTVAQIAAEFGVSRPTTYRHLASPSLLKWAGPHIRVRRWHGGVAGQIVRRQAVVTGCDIRCHRIPPSPVTSVWLIERSRLIR